MSLHKLTAPRDDVVTFIGSESDPSTRTWIIYGVGYTDNDSVARYAREAGYAVIDAASIPEEHTTAIARLEAYPIQKSRYGREDGADPEAKFRFTGIDGTTVDVRDIINGTINV